MFVRSIFRVRLRRIMRGYSNLKKSGRLSSISIIKRELTTCNLNIEERFFSASFFKAGLESAELIVRQYLLVRVGGWNLNRALLNAAGKSGGKVVMAMPPQWFKVIEANGFEVNRKASKVMWTVYIIGAYFYGIFSICKILINSLKYRITSDGKFGLKPYVYFHALALNNIPPESFDGDSYDIISWYLQWRGRQPNIKAIHHTVRNVEGRCIAGVDLVGQSGPLPMLTGVSEYASYLRWSFKTLANVLLDGLRGRWWHALLLNQAALVAQASIVRSSLLAREYLFHNSGRIYRPLWTYEVERRGSVVSFYFYSTNIEGFRPPKGLTPLNHGWVSMNWPRYLVWDRYQLNFIKRVVGNKAKIIITGPIGFVDNSKEISNVHKPAVAVFDVTPLRVYNYKIRAIEYDYYTPEVVVSFLNDICQVLMGCNVQINWKRKRNISKETHPNYRQELKKIDKNNNISIVDAGISAHRIIISSIAAISIPFTSTAIIARSLGKPSIYYDPTGKVDKNDPGAHGIPIISDVQELESWFKFQLQNI